jgi:hypothetical protein
MATHGFPLLSVVHVNPPFQGGLTATGGSPPYSTLIFCFPGKKGVDPDIKCNTKDSIPNLVQAIIQSQIIVHYCIQYRSLQSEKYPTDKNSFYSSFNSFYASKLKSIHLPEEDYLPKLSAFNATENLKKEITSYKKQLPLRFKNEIQIELKKELLKQNYQYTEAGKLNFEHSAVYSFLEKKGWVNSKVKFK